MVDLARWLGQQLDEDGRIARAATPGPWTQSGIGEYGWGVSFSRPGAGVEAEDSEQGRADAEHIAAHDPARVLREIDAKREIMGHHVPVGDGTVCLSYCHTRTPGEAQTWPCLTLRLLALPYLDRPGYRDEWKPIKLYRAGTPGVIDYEEATDE